MQAFFKITLSQTNCYLLKGTQGYLLIDCGNSGDEQLLLSKLERLGLSPPAIRYLLLTHHHSDHCGLLSFLLSANPAMKVIMSRRCAGYLAGGYHCSPPEVYASPSLGLCFRLYGLLGGKLTDALPPYFSRSGDLIFEGERQELPVSWGIPGELVATPGHTGDSISLVVGENAFVGDAARNMLNFLGAAYEPPLLSDRAACRESWNKLLALGIKRVHPGHGAGFESRHLRR